jgi:hypothetical protein
MTISRDLFLSILSMDAYNRGYNPGIAGLGDTGQIGNATILSRNAIGVTDTEYLAWQEASFYAAAYTINSGVTGIAAGTTVMSYRGTGGRYWLRHPPVPPEHCAEPS